MTHAADLAMICRSCLRAGALAGRVAAASSRSTASSLVQLRLCGTSTAWSAQRRQGRHPAPLLARDLSSIPTNTLYLRRPIRRLSTAPAPATPDGENLDRPGKPEKPEYLDEAESRIWDILTANLDPSELVVRDISGGCGSMYGIEISSEQFRGLGMLKQQRMVNAALGDIMKGWHGVQLKTRVP